MNGGSRTLRFCGVASLAACFLGFAFFPSFEGSSGGLPDLRAARPEATADNAMVLDKEKLVRCCQSCDVEELDIIRSPVLVLKCTAASTAARIGKPSDVCGIAPEVLPNAFLLRLPGCH